MMKPRIATTFKQFAGNDAGTTSIEYGLIAALISVVAIKSIHCTAIYMIIPMFENISAAVASAQT